MDLDVWSASGYPPAVSTCVIACCKGGCGWALELCMYGNQQRIQLGSYGHVMLPSDPWAVSAARLFASQICRRFNSCDAAWRQASLMRQTEILQTYSFWYTVPYPDKP